MDYLRDEDIPCAKVPNPILEAIANKRLDSADKLYLPTIPLEVSIEADRAAPHGLLVLQLIGLVVTLTGDSTVKLKPSLAQYMGMDRFQLGRSLKGLEAAGLIRTQSSPGKRRQITLLDSKYLARLIKSA